MNKILKASATTLTFLGSLHLTSCATDQAAKLRETKPVTVGFVGAAYRPTPNYSVGADFDLPFNEYRYVDEERSEVTYLKTSKSRKVTSQTSAATAFAHFYPIPTSAFFYGFAFTKDVTQYSFYEETNTSTSVSPDYTRVKYKRDKVYFGVPLGWDWIWENGFSFFLDLGPRLVLSSSKSYSKSGESEDVDIQKRNDTIQAIEDPQFFLKFGGTGIIGYSF